MVKVGMKRVIEGIDVNGIHRRPCRVCHCKNIVEKRGEEKRFGGSCEPKRASVKIGEGDWRGNGDCIPSGVSVTDEVRVKRVVGRVNIEDVYRHISHISGSRGSGNGNMRQVLKNGRHV